ncbi:MAG: PAS domain-containing protein [Acetobacteraceae bacterium]|nr:PAS domain-containing protein [Acetobacteraceae bacterium]
MRRLLLLFALALGLPLIGVAAFGTWSAVEAERARAENQMLATTRALAGVVEREVTQARLLLDLLAASTNLNEGEFLAFDAQARQGIPAPLTVALVDGAGRFRINTFVPPDERVLAGMPLVQPDFLSQVLDAGGTVISGLFRGAFGRHLVSVARPVEVNGERLALIVSVPGSRFGEILRDQRLPPGWVAAILDAGGHIVARTRAEEEFIGQVATRPVLDLLARSDEGVVRAIPTHDGMNSVAAVARTRPSGFSVAMAAPLPAGWWEAWQAVGRTTVAGVVLLGIGLILAWALAGRLLRGVTALGRGEGGTGLHEFDLAAARIASAADAMRDAIAALQESETRYRVTLEAFAGGVYECVPGEGRVLRTPSLLRLIGEAEDDPGREWWLSRLHPDDRPAMDAALAEVRAGGRDRFEMEYRVRHADGHYVWVWHRSIARRDAEGRLLRLIGCIIDVTAEHEARDAEAMVARELDHRVKNNFALVSSIVGLTAAHHPHARAFAAELRDRLRALTEAHDVVRRGAGTEGVRLHALARRLAAPFEKTPGEALVLAGEDVAVQTEAVSHLALILHEWLTNAAKHGALSRPGGCVRLAARRENGTLVLEWTEQGGPPLPGPPARRGFGSLLAEATASGRFGGALEEDWTPDGLRLALRLAADRVAAAAEVVE